MTCAFIGYGYSHALLEIKCKFWDFVFETRGTVCLMRLDIDAWNSGILVFILVYLNKVTMYAYIIHKRFKIKVKRGNRALRLRIF